MTRAERFIPNGIPKWIRVYDNGGETADRYTVVFTGHYTHKTGGGHWVLGMSENPFHPAFGVCQHDETERACDVNRSGFAPAIGRRCHLGKRIKFQDLPADCQRIVVDDYRELWDC